MTAIAAEYAVRDALNAIHPIRIPPICNVLPTLIERRANSRHRSVAVGFRDFEPKLTPNAFVPRSPGCEVVRMLLATLDSNVR